MAARCGGVVTLTTVGYGDIVPDHGGDALRASFLMITAIATLGIISGTLASFFAADTDDDTSATAVEVRARRSSVS
jgi:voltage-gated potassium channel